MKIINQPRSSGKTTELIKRCHERGGWIVCFSEGECVRVFRVAKDMGLKIALPITFDRFLNAKYSYTRTPPVYIDYLDECLRQVSRNPIDTVTFTEEEKFNI